MKLIKVENEPKKEEIVEEKEVKLEAESVVEKVKNRNCFFFLSPPPPKPPNPQKRGGFWIF